MVNRVILTCLCFFILLPSAYALEVQANVDKNPVLMDEAITLTITATGDVKRNAFDPSPLLKNFVVGNTSVSSQTRIVNFDKTQTTTWQTTLFPKKIGRFTIPSLTVEGASTRAIDVDVIPVPKNTGNEQRDYFVTAELSSDNIYVQQHVNYVVKLYMAQNIERGSLQTPSIENSSIEQVGDDNQYSDIINGKRFQVIERTFVIVPEKSGTITVQSPIFTGEVLVNNTAQRYGAFNRTQSVTRRGPQLTLDVKPIPSDYRGNWLPSEYVELTEEWSNDGQFVVGEPITRTLTLIVAGQNKDQLPEIPQTYPPFIKHYPDQPSTASASKDGIILSQRQESTAIIPSKIGPMVIPGAQITWYNTKTGKTEVASVPARSYDVQSAPQDSNSSLQTPQIPVANTDNNSSNDPQSFDTGISLNSKDNKPLLMWQLLTGFFALIWLITLYLLWRSRNSYNDKNHYLSSVSRPIETVSLTSINNAIDKKDIAGLQKYLFEWLNTKETGTYSSLSEILSNKKYNELQTALNTFMANQYGKNNGAGQGVNNVNDNSNELKTTIAKISKVDEKTNSMNNRLEPLYK